MSTPEYLSEYWDNYTKSDVYNNKPQNEQTAEKESFDNLRTKIASTAWKHKYKIALGLIAYDIYYAYHTGKSSYTQNFVSYLWNNWAPSSKTISNFMTPNITTTREIPTVALDPNATAWSGWTADYNVPLPPFQTVTYVPPTNSSLG